MKNWLLVFLWLGVIFFFSHQPDLKSGLPNIWDFILRKSAHFLEYAVLTWLFFRALGQNSRWALIGAIVFSVLYAFSDEWHQSFVPGRQSSLKDVGVDSFGALFITWFLRKRMVK